MIIDQLVKEVRGHGCGTRFFDVVQVNGVVKIKVKCRRCTKTLGHEVFHTYPLSDFSGMVDTPA